MAARPAGQLWGLVPTGRCGDGSPSFVPGEERNVPVPPRYVLHLGSGVPIWKRQGVWAAPPGPASASYAPPGFWAVSRYCGWEELGVLVSGVAVDERLLKQLSGVVPLKVGRRLDTALFYRAAVLGLTVDERRAVLAALEKPPAGLEDLREILLQDVAWRQCESM